MPKKSLSKALKEAIDNHEMVCLDDHDVIVGAAIDFDDDTSACEERCPYFIQNGNVLLTISCPAGPHEAFSGTLSIVMYEGFKRWASENGYSLESISYFGSTRVLDLINVIGCGSLVNKEPDGSFRLGKPLLGRVAAQPFLVTEVASRHESHHVLLCEAALWLNEHSSVQYILAAKIWPDSGHVLIYILKKNNQAAMKLSDQKANSTCMKENSSVPEAISKIEETYGLEIVHMFDIRGQISESDRVPIRIEMTEILAGEGIILMQSQSSSVEIDISAAVRAFFNSI